jgi:PAS domain S-box-containing protein
VSATTTPSDSRRRLAGQLRASKARILREWERAIADRPKGRPLNATELRDHIPKLLDEIIDASERGTDDVALSAAESHAHARLADGFDLGDVADEYATLRQIIHQIVGDGANALDHGDVELLDQMIDLAVSLAVTRYHDARSRTLAALDRISTAALGAEVDADAFLLRLIEAVLETTDSVDTVTILLREGDRLRVRASVGLEREKEVGFSLAIGEGFAGTIAATQKPLLLKDAARDPLVKSEHIRNFGLRALYGVPLLHGPELIGVAHMGSRRAHEFSADDVQLLHVMAQRCAALIKQHQLQQELRASEDRYRLATRATHDVIWDWDLVRDEIGWSDNLESILGYRARDIEPTSAWWRAAVHPDDRERVDAGLSHALAATDSHWNDTYRLRGSDGRYRDVIHRGTIVRDASGRGVRIVGAIQDVSERKRAEEERQMFLGILGHDLRAPLNAVMLACDYLMTRSPTAEQQRATQRIMAGTKRMARMISDLLAFSRAHVGGGIPVERRFGDLGAITKTIVDELRVGHPGRHIVVACDGNCEGEWDADRIAQLVSNLVENAIKYGRTDAPITVRTAGAAAQVALSVHNLGEPIPVGLLPRLFEPFATAHGRRDSMGLGLYIADQIVRAHGGRIEVESSLAEGTTFRASLPRFSEAIAT